MEAVEMNCMRNICGLRRIDRVSNVEIRRMCGKGLRRKEERRKEETTQDGKRQLDEVTIGGNDTLLMSTLCR